MKKMFKIINIIVAILLILLGIIGCIMPIMPGGVFLIIGLIHLIKNSSSFRKWFINSKIYKKYLKKYKNNLFKKKKY